MTRTVLTLLVAAVCLVGCTASEPSAPETPAQGISAIIGLYEAGDFESLVRTRYAEIDKAESEEQIQTLINRLRDRFQDGEAREEAVASYKAALLVEPELSEDGEVATFSVEGGLIRVSRMADGRWGFHL